MSNFRKSELQELEEEFFPEGTDFYSGSDNDEALTDQQLAVLEKSYQSDKNLQDIRGADDQVVDDDYVKELIFN